MNKTVFASRFNLIVNIILFAMKLVAGLISGSIAILSDAFNSFTDIVTSVIVFYSVRISNKKPDNNHPFGHKRAEPIAALVICVLIGVLGFEIIRSSLIRIFIPETISMTSVVIFLMGASIIAKLFMWLYLRIVSEKENSAALKATSIDSRNDVMVSFLALFGFLVSFYGFGFLDAVFGIIIAVLILKSGYELMRDNIGYLMGESANKEFYSKVRKIAHNEKQVVGVHCLKIHYVGTVYHVQVHLEVDGNLTTFQTHKISNRVERKILKLPDVDAVFLHIDPVRKASH